MNEELLIIRDINGYDGDINRCRRLDEESSLLYHYKLNYNMAQLFFLNQKTDYDEKKFVHIFIENIYYILSMFNEMNVFPGYFFRKAFEMNAKYYERRKDFADMPNDIRTKNGIRGDYKFYRDTHLSVWIGKEIEKGIENGYYHVQAYPKTNLSDAFLEILALFQKYDFTYKVATKEDCKKVFSDINYNYMTLSDELLNSDTLEEDIEYMSRMLFDHISFFVAIGVNPKKFLDDYLENEAENTHKKFNEELQDRIRAKEESRNK